MYRKVFTFPVLIATLAIVFNSCSKDDNNESPNNTTNGKTSAVFNPNVTYGTMTDQEGNVYKTLTIGTQTWMAENLRTTIYNDNTPISNETNDYVWPDLTTGAYCNYNNTTNKDDIATYGCLYNWYAVNTGILAPKGWHVPTDEEWTTLIDYIGPTITITDNDIIIIDDQGEKLKETNTTHWNSPNTGATNESGFTALPGGYRYWDFEGHFSEIGETGNWWSSTSNDTERAWYRSMYYKFSRVDRKFSGDKHYGFSVRCVKD